MSKPKFQIRQGPNNWRSENRHANRNTHPSRRQKNPLDRNERVSKCESIYHWQQDCPEQQNDTDMVHEIVLHNKNGERGQLKNLDKVKRVVRSTPAAETLASADEADTALYL